MNGKVAHIAPFCSWVCSSQGPNVPVWWRGGDLSPATESLTGQRFSLDVTVGLGPANSHGWPVLKPCPENRFWGPPLEFSVWDLHYFYFKLSNVQKDTFASGQEPITLRTKKVTSTVAIIPAVPRSERQDISCVLRDACVPCNISL